MIYVTTRQKSKEVQLNWLDLIEDNDPTNSFSTQGSAGTITKAFEEVPSALVSRINVDWMINTLKKFNMCHEELALRDKKSLYSHFYLAKKTGGLRPIDAPCNELKVALSELSMILTEKFGLLHHTSAFAYVPGRSTTQCVRKHQSGNPNWIYKTDVSGFFPSTTLDFTMKMLKMIFPTSEVCKTEEGYNELKKALSLGFLNGVLPQGTPLSP